MPGREPDQRTARLCLIPDEAAEHLRNTRLAIAATAAAGSRGADEEPADRVMYVFPGAVPSSRHLHHLNDAVRHDPEPRPEHHQMREPFRRY